MRALFACADELPSAEYLLVDDGSTNSTGELPAVLASLAHAHGIRYQLARYPTAVGFTLATTEAARRANGTYLLFVNNDAFVTRGALAAMLATFDTLADVGAVGAQLIGEGAPTTRNLPRAPRTKPVYGWYGRRRRRPGGWRDRVVRRFRRVVPQGLARDPRR